jgi:type IV pilus assembly protein PilB
LTTIPPHQRKRRLGEILKDAGVLTELQLSAALQEQRKWGGRLGRTLVEMGFVDENSMMLALSRQLNLPVVDLDKAILPDQIAKVLRVDIAERYGVFPVNFEARTKNVQIATSDPTNQDQMSELEFHTGMRVTVALSSPSAIDRAIRRYYYGDSSSSTTAATPQSLGVSENTYNEDELSDPRLKGPRAPGGGASSRDVQELTARLSQALQQISTLEQLVASQVRVVRGLVELLVEKGVVKRDDYLAKIRGPNQQ